MKKSAKKKASLPKKRVAARAAARRAISSRKGRRGASPRRATRPVAAAPAKSRATTSHLSAAQLREYRRILQEKYDELSAWGTRSEEIMPEVGDDIDLARTTLEKEISHELTDNQRIIMDAISAALAKLDQGTFGVCETCGKPIPATRLKAMPWARCCIVCQSTVEKS